MIARSEKKPITSFRCMLAAVGTLLVMIFICRMYANGVSLTVETNVPGAQVALDDNSRWLESGSRVASFEKIPFGRRQLVVSHPDYESSFQVVSVGWFSFSPRARADLKPRPVELTIRTTPNAEVFLNGVSAGRAGEDGVFFKPDVVPGEYQIGVRLSGYTQWNTQGRLRPPNRQFWASLQMSPEKLLEIQENRAKIVQHIGEARRLFGARDYQGALAALGAALTIDPQNSEARSLREQVEQTMKILGGR